MRHTCETKVDALHERVSAHSHGQTVARSAERACLGHGRSYDVSSQPIGIT